MRQLLNVKVIVKHYADTNQYLNYYYQFKYSGICGSQIDGWYVKDSAPHYYCQKDSGGWTLLWLCIDCMIPPVSMIVTTCYVSSSILNCFEINLLFRRLILKMKLQHFWRVAKSLIIILWSQFQTISCWIDTFKLDISDVNNIKNRAGVQTKVNDFGYTDGIGYLDEVSTQ